jgi:hypothetical protein
MVVAALPPFRRIAADVMRGFCLDQKSRREKEKVALPCGWSLLTVGDEAAQYCRRRTTGVGLSVKRMPSCVFFFLTESHR